MGLKVFPHPARLRNAGYSALHPLGIERGRAETIRGVCARADRLEAIAASSTSLEFDEMFQKFPGIGPWTSGVVRGGALGDPDAVIVGDLHLPHTITYALTGRESGTDDEMLELLEPFRGQRGRVQGLLAHSGTKPPRRAPRYRPLPIAKM
jgi:3-methyladenine DNA glycosylase/8-oxoguanine DNA glycosylase